jgi:hypothetical protein
LIYPAPRPKNPQLRHCFPEKNEFFKVYCTPDIVRLVTLTMCRSHGREKCLLHLLLVVSVIVGNNIVVIPLFNIYNSVIRVSVVLLNALRDANCQRGRVFRLLV